MSVRKKIIKAGTCQGTYLKIMEKDQQQNQQQKQQIQLNADPNAYYISMMNIRFDEEGFHFLLASGNQAKQYAASPKHAKRIHLLLKQQIDNYENQFGEIKTQLPERPQATQGENKIGF